MKSMDFEKCTVEKAVETVQKHAEWFEAIRKKDENLSIEEFAQNLIITKFNDSQIEAEEIVEDIKKGLVNFDIQFNNNKDSEMINVRECLEKTTQGCTEEERKNCYVNILTAVELIDEKNVTENDVNAKLAKNAELSEEELIKKIEKSTNSLMLLNLLANNVKDGFNSDTLSQLVKEIELNKDEYRLMVALCLYMEQREGNLKLSDTEFAISAEQIGILAGATIEAMIANNDLNEGKIDLTTWQKVMKYIVGAVFTLAWIYLSIVVCAKLGLMAVALILSVIGSSTIALLISLIVGFVVVSKVSNLYIEAWNEILNVFITFYDNNIVQITAKIAKWIEMLKESVKKLTNKAKTVVSGNKNQTEAEETNVNNEEQELQSEPVMA